MVLLILDFLFFILLLVLLPLLLLLFLLPLPTPNHRPQHPPPPLLRTKSLHTKPLGNDPLHRRTLQLHLPIPQHPRRIRPLRPQAPLKGQIIVAAHAESPKATAGIRDGVSAHEAQGRGVPAIGAAIFAGPVRRNPGGVLGRDAGRGARVDGAEEDGGQGGDGGGCQGNDDEWSAHDGWCDRRFGRGIEVLV